MTPQEHVRHWQELTKQRPKFPDVWHNLGLTLTEIGDHEAALEAFTQALVVHPAYSDAEVSRCFALVEVGRKVEAFGEYRRIFNRDPDGFRASFPFGILCMRAGWRRTGYEQLQRAASLKPDSPFVRGFVAAACQQLGREAEAQEEVGRMRRTLQGLNVECFAQYAQSEEAADLTAFGNWRDPALVKIPVLLAHSSAMDRDFSGARERLRLANLRFPGNSDLMVEMSKVLLASGEEDRAMEWLAGAVCVDPHANRAFFEASFIHAHRGNFGAAAEALRKAVALRPLYPDYRYHLGTLLMDLGESEEAIRHLLCGLTVNPRYGQARLQLARAYLTTGQPETALQALNDDSCRDWPEAAILSAQACLKQGHRDEAVKLYQAALRMDETHVEAREGLELLSQG